MAAAGATGQTRRSGLMATIPDRWFEYPNLKELIEGECAVYVGEPKRCCLDFACGP